MKLKTTLLSLILLSLFSFAAENWKGEPSKSEITVSSMGGLGLLDGTGAATLLGSISKKIIHKGFSDEINNQVFIEAEFGPMFVFSSTHLLFGAHLRWDFTLNPDWTFFGFGGFGMISTSSVLQNRVQAFPRFGIGAFWHFSRTLSLRMDISHEFSGAGFTLWF